MKIENRLERAISILKQLISYPVIGGESNLSISRYIEDIFKQHGVDYHHVYNETGDKVSLHCRLGPPSNGGIILSGHMDVVPAEGQPWTRQAFDMSRDQNRLYGRGTTDMKGFLACCLALLPDMIEAPLQRPIYLAFSYDEEIGCLAGPALASNILKTYTEKPAYAIIGEPTSMITCTSGKGIGVFTTHVKSSAAHSSEIRTSVSAINEATLLIQWLNNTMERLLTKSNLDHRFDPPHTTVHVGTIHGGTAVNIVADSCTFQWDVRNIPSDDIHQILKSFSLFCSERVAINSTDNPEFSIHTEAKFPVVVPLDTPMDARITTKVNEWTNTSTPSSVSFGTEAGQFAEVGFQAVICGPGNMEQGHRADEYIEIEQIEECISMLNNIIMSHCKS
ncbi:MAG: acetylornithine deacetylase [Bacteroidia bacterium]|nr:acetylornithine deacetylase [Bacteroidia bacterium]